jgi:hypothetical protein
MWQLSANLVIDDAGLDSKEAAQLWTVRSRVEVGERCALVELIADVAEGLFAGSACSADAAVGVASPLLGRDAACVGEEDRGSRDVGMRRGTQ